MSDDPDFPKANHALQMLRQARLSRNETAAIIEIASGPFRIQKRKCPGSRGTSFLPSGADIVSLPRHVRLVPKHKVAAIGIGGSLAAPPLPHHRTYGSVYGGSRSYANALRSNDSTRVGWAFGGTCQRF